MPAIFLALVLSGAASGPALAQVPSDTATRLPAAPATGSNVGVAPKGGGLFVKSEDGRAVVRLMGYAQPTFIATAQSNKQAYKVPSFFVRRARADFKAEYDSLYTLFFEYDAGPPAGTSLVEGYAQAALVRDYLNFRMGKYIQPFSAENVRSSRALETVERFLALNAVIGMPAFDAQIGAMLFGTLDPGKQVKYFLSVNNGNGSASTGGNVKDNNADKDWIARLEYAPVKAFRVGVAGDYDKEQGDKKAGQALVVRSYAGAIFDTIRVYGQRVAADVDVHYQMNGLGLEGEWLWADFADTNATLHGGYVQAGYWVKGNEADGGIEPLLRLEYVRLGAKHPIVGSADEVDGSTLMAATLGVNWWMNGWTRWQLNVIEETTSKKGNGAYAAADDGRFLPTLFAQFQIKF
jgi:phosphate-selective porin